MITKDNVSHQTSISLGFVNTISVVIATEWRNTERIYSKLQMGLVSVQLRQIQVQFLLIPTTKYLREKIKLKHTET